MAEATPAEQSFLGMSDEDVLKAMDPSLGSASAPQEPAAEPVEAPAQEDSAEESAEVEANEDDAGDGGTPSQAADEEADDEEEDTPASGDKDPDPGEKDKPEVKDPKPEESTLNYEAEYKRLLAPFKANGRDIQVTSVDDAIALMQMGANYNKKMAGLKPNLKFMKMLENNGLLNEEKLSYLIELDKKSPDAINKLVKDSGLNPMDFDAEKAGDYKPKIHAVDEREIVLDTVLDEIQETDSYNRTVKIVGQEWDGPSKQVIAQTPQLLKVINSHVASGIYDLISAEMERERMFGRLTGLSDIEAYRQVGDAIQARGGFDHLAASQQGSPSAAPVVVQPKPKKVDDPRLNEKRRAASTTKPAVPTSVPQEFNPLALSDEEFNKLAESRFR
jgi:hypothetical protein